jgi:hypothetical protein
LVKYILEIESHISSLQIDAIYLVGPGRLPVGQKRDEVADRNGKTLTWISNEINAFDEKFSSFMELNKI